VYVTRRVTVIVGATAKAATSWDYATSPASASICNAVCIDVAIQVVNPSAEGFEPPGCVLEQRARQADAAMCRSDRDPIGTSPPTIPADDHRLDDLGAVGCDQQRAGEHRQ
jgi:hypothetical protein